MRVTLLPAMCIFAGWLVACGGSAAAPASSCTPLPVPMPPPMIYPQTKATNVPDGDFTLVLGFSYGSTTSLASASSTVGPLSTTPVPSFLPSGSATPLPGVTPAAYSVPTLQAATNYMVIAHFIAPGCPAGQDVGGIGYFTTK